MKQILASGIIIFLISCINLHCQRELFFNKPPIALAGPDQKIKLPIDSIMLDGSASSDPEGGILSFKWKNILSPSPCIISNVINSKTGIKSLVAGIYLFELKVTDNENQSSLDTVRITVVNSDPPPITKPIKIIVQEYGTNLPIEGAALRICLLPAGVGCTGNYSNFTTDINGMVTFNGNKYHYGGVNKIGYWALDYNTCFVKFYQDDPTLQNGIHTSDSVVVKMVPQTYAIIHVRDSSGIGHDVNLYREGYFDYCGYYPWESVPLRQHIDSTFGYLVFGNVNNLFTIADAIDTSGFQNEYLQRLIYIPKNNPPSLELIY